MKQEKKEAMLKLEPAPTDNRSLASRARRFFTVPSGRNGLKIATIFFLCVLIVTFFSFLIGAAKNNYQPYRHHNDRHVYSSKRTVAVKIPSKSTTHSRTPTKGFPPAFVRVVILLICIAVFLFLILVLWLVFDWIRTWTSEPSQHPGPLPLTGSGSSTTATDAACAALCIPWPSTANRQPVNASSRMGVAPRRDEDRNLFGRRSRAPAGDRDSVVPTSHGCEALSSDESPEHRLVLRRRYYEDRSPYPSPCGSSASSSDHGCGEPDGGPTTGCPTATDPIQPELCYEGELLQGSFPCQDYDPIHDPYFHSGDRTVDMDQTPFLDPMRPCSPSVDPIHDTYLHSGDQNLSTDPITLCPPSADPAAQEPASGEESSRSATSNTDWSGSISFRFLLSVPDAGGDEPGLGGAEDVDAPTVSAAAGDGDDNGNGDGDDDGNGDDDDEMSVPSWVGPPVLPR